MPAQRWISWLLLVAFLHGVLAPAVGQTMGRENTARTILTQLCGANGLQLVEVELHQVDPQDAGAKSDTLPAAERSGFCLLCVYPATPPQTGIAALQPAAPPSVPVSVPDDPEPRLVAAWSPAHPRAPPFGM